MEGRTVFYVTLAACTGVVLRRLWNYQDSGCKVRPPSPPSLPLVGNLLSIPPGMDHVVYMELGKQLNSDIIFLNLLGMNIVVLNSSSAATDLLDKRSSIYSDRASTPMIKDPKLMNWPGMMSLLEYGDVWRSHRSMFNNWLNARAAPQFHGLQENQTRLMLQRLFKISNSPQPFEDMKNVLFFTTSTLMFQLAYGYRLRDDQDPFLKDILEAMDNLINGCVFSNFLVNLIPALSYVPEWFPGANWKRTAREWREQKDRAIDTPFLWAKEQVAAGVAEPSILRALLQNHKLTLGWDIEDRDSRLKELAMVTYIGGTETSSNLLLTFAAAMVMNPHIQAKAQQELDTVIGPLTLPTVADRERLPYIQNIILETLRWIPVLPLALPHVCYRDDVYRGYNIDKGTLVMGNLWAMSRDANVYKNPDAFDPDRFQDPNTPPLPVFGWGRRKCPGTHFGEASLFLGITHLLATFSFSAKKDVNGKEIIPEIEPAANNAVLTLKPFEFEFRLRSEKHRKLIVHEGA